MNDKKFTFRDLVWLMTLAVGVLSTFFIMQNKINTLDDEVKEMKSTLQDNNLELINYKVDQMNKKQDEFYKSFSDFVADYNGK